MSHEPAAPHLVILAATLSILLAACLLAPSAPGDSLLLGGHALPTICLLRQTIGVPCPGCGLTRSLVAGVHADWAGSLAHHRLGLVVLGYLLLQSLTRLAWLGWPRLRIPLTGMCRALDLSLVPLLILLVLNWIPILIGVVGAMGSA